MASAAADTPGRSIELTDVTVSGPISGGLSAQDGNQEAVLGSPLRATAELVKGDASAVGPTHTGGHADPAEKHEPEVQAGVVWTVFNFLNSIVGAGIIGLPFAFKEAGFVSGLPLLLIMAYATNYSVCLLISMGLRTKTRGYEDLCRAVFGRFGDISVTLSMWFFALIIIGDTVGLVITHMMDTAVTATTRRVIIGVTATVVILPLSLVKNMAMLSRSSAVSIGAVLWIVGFVVIKAIVGVGDDVVVPTTSEERQVHVVSTNFFPAVGVIAFAFVCHHSCFIVFNSLKNNTPQRWALTSRLSIGAASGLCCLLAVPGYFVFREDTRGNLLNNFAQDDVFANVTRLIFSLTMVLTYPMEIFVARHTLHSLFYTGKMTNFQHYAFTLALWGSSVLVALAVDDLGFVLELTGGVSGTYIGYIMPGMLYLRLADYRLAFWKNKGREWETFKDMFAPAVLFVFGVVACVNGTLLTIKNAIEDGI